MIINQFKVMDFAILPFETQAELVVYADAVLACPVTGQFFKIIRRRITQIRFFFCCVNNQHFSISNLYGWLFQENNGAIHNLTVKGHYEFLHACFGAGIIANTNGSSGLILNSTTENSPMHGMLHIYTGTAGGIVGYNYGTIENSANYANISVWDVYKASSPSSRSNSVVSVGGIAGENHGIIIGCINNGDLYTGGMSWYYVGEEYYGGIAGTHAGGSIKNSDTHGIIVDNHGVAHYSHSHYIGNWIYGENENNSCECDECV